MSRSRWRRGGAAVTNEAPTAPQVSHARRRCRRQSCGRRPPGDCRCEWWCQFRRAGAATPCDPRARLTGGWATEPALGVPQCPVPRQARCCTVSIFATSRSQTVSRGWTDVLATSLFHTRILFIHFVRGRKSFHMPMTWLVYLACQSNCDGNN